MPGRKEACLSESVVLAAMAMIDCIKPVLRICSAASVPLRTGICMFIKTKLRSLIEALFNAIFPFPTESTSKLFSSRVRVESRRLTALSAASRTRSPVSLLLSAFADVSGAVPWLKSWRKVMCCLCFFTDSSQLTL
jgi:hypothetical protein